MFGAQDRHHRDASLRILQTHVQFVFDVEIDSARCQTNGSDVRSNPVVFSAAGATSRAPGATAIVPIVTVVETITPLVRANRL